MVRWRLERCSCQCVKFRKKIAEEQLYKRTQAYSRRVRAMLSHRSVAPVAIPRIGFAVAGIDCKRRASPWRVQLALNGPFMALPKGLQAKLQAVSAVASPWHIQRTLNGPFIGAVTGYGVQRLTLCRPVRGVQRPVDSQTLCLS